jgi:hypothetical protein
MRNTAIIVALLAMTGLSAGADEAKNDTPKAALQTMFEAMAKNDADTFVSCFDATEDEAKVLRAMGNYMGTAVKFQKAMIDAYGDEGVMENMKGLQGILDGTWKEKLEIKIDGEKAVATAEGEDKSLELIKKAGSWKIAADSMIPNAVKRGDPPADVSEAVDKEVRMFQLMADGQKKVMPMIGKEGKTAEDIKEIIGALVMKAFLENKATPGAE